MISSGVRGERISEIQCAVRTVFLVVSLESNVIGVNPLHQVYVIADKGWDLTLEDGSVAAHYKHIIDLSFEVLLHHCRWFQWGEVRVSGLIKRVKMNFET